MPRFAAFLGSVNVGGNQLKMDALKSALSAAGFANVETVAASGNVLFDHDRAPDESLAREIVRIVDAVGGFRTFAAVRSRDEVAEAIALNPFSGVGEDKFVHTHFLDGEMSSDGFAKLTADHKGPEKLAAGKRELYVDYVDGVGTSKLTKAFIDRRLGRQGTARNMRSLARILEKMDAQS